MIEWTKSTHCNPETMQHCDCCPYALARPDGATALPLTTDDRAGIEDHYLPPRGRVCPHGVAWAGGRGQRGETLVRRVARGRIALATAMAVAEDMGLELDAQTEA